MEWFTPPVHISTFCVPCARVYTSALEHSPYMCTSAYGDKDTYVWHVLDSVVYNLASKRIIQIQYVHCIIFTGLNFILDASDCLYSFILMHNIYICMYTCIKFMTS